MNRFVAGAFMSDALNFRIDLSGNLTSKLVEVPSNSIYTINYESYNTNSNDQNGKLTLRCGSTTLLHVQSMARVPEIERFKMAKCQNSIYADITGTTGSPDITTNIIYLPYNIASATLGDMTINSPHFDLFTGVLLLIGMFTILITHFKWTRR